jgi:hypothetical protein
MSITLRPFRRFPVRCAIAYNAGPFHGQGTVENLSCTDWCHSRDLPLRPGEPILPSLTLPNEQCVETPEAVVLWFRKQKFAVENLAIEPHRHIRFQRYVKRLVQTPVEIVL